MLFWKKQSLSSEPKDASLPKYSSIFVRSNIEKHTFLRTGANPYTTVSRVKTFIRREEKRTGDPMQAEEKVIREKTEEPSARVERAAHSPVPRNKEISPDQ